MFIAWGTFTLSHTANSAGGIVTAGDLEPEHSTAFGLHSVNSIVVSVLALALFVVSFFAKTVHHRIRWALALFLTVVVQGELGYAGYDLPALGLLHGLGALAVFTLALRSARLPAGTAENATVEAPAATAAN
jgi:heme A synthase